MNREVGYGTPQACASCKHQRKKCDETCELAPYFPAAKFQEFLNAYKLFGVSNIIKILNSVEPHQRHLAAESIIKEANIRKDDPVHGCAGVVQNLQSQIEFHQKELHLVNQQLALFRKKEMLQQQQLQRLWINTKSSMPSTSSVQPITEHFSHSPSSSSSELPADRFESSYPSATLSCSLHQIDDPYCQAPILPDLPSDAFYLEDTKSFDDHGYNYPSTLEDVKPYDIESMDQMMDAHQIQDGDAFNSFKEPQQVPCAKTRAHGKQTVDYDFDSGMKRDTGLPSKLKDGVPKKMEISEEI